MILIGVKNRLDGSQTLQKQIIRNVSIHFHRLSELSTLKYLHSISVSWSQQKGVFCESHEPAHAHTYTRSPRLFIAHPKSDGKWYSISLFVFFLFKQWTPFFSICYPCENCFLLTWIRHGLSFWRVRKAFWVNWCNAFNASHLMMFRERLVFCLEFDFNR